MINPIANVPSGQAYAAGEDKCQTTEGDNGVCAMELGIMMNGTNLPYNEVPATTLSTTETAYRAYSFTVRAVDTKDGYKLYANAVNTTVGDNDYTNKLVNMDDPETSIIVPVSGTVTGNAMPGGQWGYALAGGQSGTALDADQTTLSYEAVPTGQPGTDNQIVKGDDTKFDGTWINDGNGSSTSGTYTDDSYKLYFAAKATDEMRSGHYRTQVQLSLVADAKTIAKGGFGGVQKMSELTTAVCASVQTPAANVAPADVPQGQLIDDREGDNGTKYWVAKLADGNCWMTQNMAYSGIAATSGNFNQTNKNKVLNGTSATDIGTREPSDDPNMTDVLSADGKTYNAHYRIGNYYPQSTGAAAQACDFSSKNNSYWKLPTSNNTNNGSFGYLITTKYSIGSNAAGSTKLQSAPLYFLRAGYYDSSLKYVGSYGYYWSSTSRYVLYFDSSSVDPSYITGSDRGGYSVRCLVSGS